MLFSFNNVKKKNIFCNTVLDEEKTTFKTPQAWFDYKSSRFIDEYHLMLFHSNFKCASQHFNCCKKQLQDMFDIMAKKPSYKDEIELGDFPTFFIKFQKLMSVNAQNEEKVGAENIRKITP